MSDQQIITPDLFRALQSEEGLAIFSLFSDVEAALGALCPDNAARKNAVNSLVHSLTFSLASLSAPAAQPDSPISRIRAMAAAEKTQPAVRQNGHGNLPNVQPRPTPRIVTSPGNADITVPSDPRTPIQTFDVRPSELVRAEAIQYRPAHPQAICNQCNGTYDSHPIQKSAAPMDGRFPVMICSGELVIL